MWIFKRLEVIVKVVIMMYGDVITHSGSDFVIA